jgi:hypothetical protein
MPAKEAQLHKPALFPLTCDMLTSVYITNYKPQPAKHSSVSASHFLTMLIDAAILHAMMECHYSVSILPQHSASPRRTAGGSVHPDSCFDIDVCKSWLQCRMRLRHCERLKLLGKICSD